MEIINVTGYTIEEKVEIAKQHLLPKQIKEHGLTKENMKIGKKQLEKIVEGYTRESGVRGLEKQFAKMVRYAAKNIAMEEEYNIKIKDADIEEVLGSPKMERDKYEDNETAGVVTGLAWTQVGGDILFIESILSKGKGTLNITGNLGKVMKESATIALEYIKGNAEELGIDPEVMEKVQCPYSRARRCNTKRWSKCGYYYVDFSGVAVYPAKSEEKYCDDRGDHFKRKSASGGRD